MKRLSCVLAVVLSVAIAMPAAAMAQSAVRPSDSSGSQGAPQTLKVTVVLSRYSGEKKITSLPFVLLVLAGDDRPTTVQMSSQLPYPTSAVTDGKTVMSYSYQNIGTNIRASAKALDAGLFNVSLTISDSQMMSDALAPEALKGLVKMQNFSSEPRLLLRDGGTIQYAAATDKTTGEVVKVDVTLNVIR